jgi:tripartite motif-containing protein 71
VPGVNSPRGIRVDAGGRISVVDYWNQRIESVDASGQNALVFGFRGRRSLPGSLNFAWDMAFQPGTGRIFVANRESNDIVVFNSDGTFVMKWSRSGHKPGTVMLPQGLTFAPDGTLLVADSGNGRIQRFSIDSTGKGTYVAKYGQQGTVAMGPSFLNHPTGISVAADGTIWVADTLNGSIQSMSPTGTWTRYNRTSGQSFRVPWGVTVAPDGSIWVADTGHDQITKMDNTGHVIFTATGPQMGTSALNGPSAIAFGSNGHVYVSDTWNNRVIDLLGA